MHWQHTDGKTGQTQLGIEAQGWRRPKLSPKRGNLPSLYDADMTDCYRIVDGLGLRWTFGVPLKQLTTKIESGLTAIHQSTS